MAIVLGSILSSGRPAAGAAGRPTAGSAGRPVAGSAGADKLADAGTAPDRFTLDRHLRGLELPSQYAPVTVQLTPQKDLSVCGVRRPVISAEATRVYSDRKGLLLVKVFAGPDGGLRRYFSQLGTHQTCTEANGQRLTLRRKAIGRLGALEIRGEARAAMLNGMVSFVHTDGYLVAVQMLRVDLRAGDVALVERVQRTVTSRLSGAGGDDARTG